MAMTLAGKQGCHGYQNTHLYKMAQRRVNGIARPMIYISKERGQRQPSNSGCIISILCLGAEIIYVMYILLP